MLIWRVETADGRGPWQHGKQRSMMSIAEDILDDGDEADWDRSPHRHPGPAEDDLIRPVWYQMHDDDRQAHRFAFKSLADVYAWFDSVGWRRALRKVGAHLVTYEVSPTDVVLGEVQLIFRYAQATLRSREPLPVYLGEATEPPDTAPDELLSRLAAPEPDATADVFNRPPSWGELGVDWGTLPVLTFSEDAWLEDLSLRPP